MQAIWKFPLEVTDSWRVEMPAGADVLTVQTQRDKPFLWAIVDTEEEVVVRTFATYGTGHEHFSISGQYVGTYKLENDFFVFHVFDVTGE